MKGKMKKLALFAVALTAAISASPAIAADDVSAIRAALKAQGFDASKEMTVKGRSIMNMWDSKKMRALRAPAKAGADPVVEVASSVQHYTAEFSQCSLDLMCDVTVERDKAKGEDVKLENCQVKGRGSKTWGSLFEHHRETRSQSGDGGRKAQGAR